MHRSIRGALLMLGGVPVVAVSSALCGAQRISSENTFINTAVASTAGGQDKQSHHWNANPEPYYASLQVVPSDNVSVPVLEYHEANYVPGNAATLKPGQLASEFDWLHRQGFHTINFGQLYAAMYHGYKLPSRPVLLTFDDGYESVYFKVFPLLKKYDFQATLFVVSGFTHDSPNRNKAFPTLTTSELRAMEASGFVDVEDHTMYHSDLRKVSGKEAEWEISGSTAALERIVGHPIRFFCYPNGSYDAKTIEMVKDANYLLAVTQHEGYANLKQGPLTLNRLPVVQTTSLNQFAQMLAPSVAYQSSSSQSKNSAALAAEFNQGAAAFSKHDYSKALQIENDVIRQVPGYYQAYNIKGIALAYLGDYSGAMANIDQALRIKSDFGYAVFNKALTYERFEHYNEAISTYQMALKLSASDWWKAWAFYGIASIYGRRGDVQGTVQYLKQAIACDASTVVAARTERDFDNVRGSMEFQMLIR